MYCQASVAETNDPLPNVPLEIGYRLGGEFLRYLETMQFSVWVYD